MHRGQCHPVFRFPGPLEILLFQLFLVPHRMFLPGLEGLKLRRTLRQLVCCLEKFLRFHSPELRVGPEIIVIPDDLSDIVHRCHRLEPRHRPEIRLQVTYPVLHPVPVLIKGL